MTSQDLDLDLETVQWMIRQLYLSGYYNEQHLNDVEPGYEYAVQQLLCDMRERNSEAFEHQTELKEMKKAQDRFEQ